MTKINFFILIIILCVSCQHQNGIIGSTPPNRSLANNSVMRIFLQEVANRTKTMTVKNLEDEALKFIKYYNSKTNVGNWEQIGITKQQAQKIKSLYDDMPYMNKVRKWVRSNITKVSMIQSNAAEQAFEIIMRGKPSYINPYKYHSQGTSGMVSSRRKSISPFLSITQHQTRVAKSIQDLSKNFDKLNKYSLKKLQDMQRRYKEVMAVMIKRGKTAPIFLANGNEIIESACKITQKTGRSGMGPGCRKFNETASESIIANKADIDQLRAQIIEQKAYDKAGKVFNSFEEVAPAKRLTQIEIDDATIEAFKKVNAMTDDEARFALNRLKQDPCKIY